MEIIKLDIYKIIILYTYKAFYYIFCFSTFSIKKIFFFIPLNKTV